MTKLNPDHATYPGTDTRIEYRDVVTRGKASTLWEVVETEYPDTVRLSRIGSYGETNAHAKVKDLTFCHRTLFPGYSSCQSLLDMQEQIREGADLVREQARYVRRVDQLGEDTADMLHRKTAKLRAAVTTHRRVLADTYGIKDQK